MGFKKICQPHDPPQEPVLQLPPLPKGLVEVMENPDRYPASMKSTLIAPHFSRRLASTKNCKPPSSNTLSLSFDSSRAKPREGPLQPPCIRAMRTAELILFCSRYDFRLFIAKSVTSNINASSKVKCSFASRKECWGYDCKIKAIWSPSQPKMRVEKVNTLPQGDFFTME